jgi:Protein of unknown function (DUF2851).
MTEKLLQFIWQFQYFNRSHLTTVQGDLLEIIFPGTLNTHQGPDFNNAQIRIGNTILAGSIEIHLKSSQWLEHGHDSDKNYHKVILHVVMEDDLSLNNSIPVLELNGRVSRIMLDQYSRLMNYSTSIPCASSLSSVKDIVWLGWKDRLMAERLTRKSEFIFNMAKENKFHWEETLWWMIARNFGIKVNADAFEAMARSLTINLLAKHKNQIHHLEALLLGQAGLLDKDFQDDYLMLLKREYQFLRKKYNLNPIKIPVHFLRMRPGSFPTIRLAQLAMLIQQSNHLFSQLLEKSDCKEIRNLLSVTANDYWLYHYLPDQPSPYKVKRIGSDMIDNLIINTIAPVLFAYGSQIKEEKFKEKAIRFLQETNSENNQITKEFKLAGIVSGSAFDSQMLIELRTNYCDSRNCLRCAVGNWLLKTQPATNT